MNNEYTCHSGGCPGADMAWEMIGEQYGIHTVAYSFGNHKQEGKHPKILSISELQEGYVHARIADRKLKRNFDGIQYPYIKNLLARNWFQVKNSDAIFAVAWLKDYDIVDGGTGWAVQMAIDCDKPVYVYVQSENLMELPPRGSWHRWMITRFERIDYIPKLTKNFAGIGSRKLTDCGLKAIANVYENTFGVLVKGENI